MHSDRRAAVKRLAAARRRLGQNLPADQIVLQLESAFAKSIALLRQRLDRKLDIRFDEILPIARHRDEISRAIAANQVVVLCGDTGSGKTTQLPKILLELGRGRHATIGHTQPRRLAARSVAQRIADELQSPLGDVVGYKVRFNDQTSPANLVKLMTDGILLAETQHDRELLEYDTIIIDEAHERTLNIDFLLGYLKQLLARRPDLKLIITSATIDPERFSKHFDNAPIVLVEGRTFPVEVIYRPPMSDDPEDSQTLLADGIVQAVDELWSQVPGDTLVFLPGEREIREVAEALGNHRQQRMEILPLFARLGVAEQMQIFKPGSKPRVVLSTNVAETSLTVPGIRYVIDSGLARISRYSTRNKIQRLPIEPISRASADQRKGRCGRVQAGVCVRLYAPDDFEARPQFTDPEILRTNLTSVILQMKAYNLGRIEDFPFIDPPDYRQVRDGYQSLYELGALDENNEITDLGRMMARLPIDPTVARMLIAARDQNCVVELLVLASALSVQDPRDRPMDKQGDADQAHARWRVAASDFLSFLNLWKEYCQNERSLSNNRLRKWCQTNFLSATRMREWADVHRQLAELAGEMDWRRNPEPAGPDAIHNALLAGLLSRVGRRGEQGEYQGVRNSAFWIFPGSALFQRKPAWVMASEIVETTKTYARTVAEIEPNWIEQAAPNLIKRTYFEPHWQRKTGRVMAYEKVLFQGLILVAKRSVAYETIDPKTSRELFIHHALVEGDVDLAAPFFTHNQALVREIELLEARTRRRDILVDPRTRYAFYDARLPATVTSLQSFNKWRGDAEHANKRVLHMEMQDLMLRSEHEIGAAAFPTKLKTSAGELRLSYHFEPGSANDGVTLTLPLAAIASIDPDILDWLVPGLLEEKIIDLIRTLPKSIRVNVVPAPEFAARAARAMDFGVGNLSRSLAGALGRLTGISIRAEDFAMADVIEYLKMHLVVVDQENRPIAHGRDIYELRGKLRDKLRELLAKEIDPKWHRDGLKTWDFGDMPPRVELRRAGTTVQAFPGLVDLDNGAALRLFDSLAAARMATRGGVRRLFVIEYASELKWHINDLSGIHDMCLHFAPLGGATRLKPMLVEALAHQLITPDAADVRTRMEYELQLRAAWNRLTSESNKLADITRRSLAEYHAVCLRLSTRVPPLLQASIDDMKQQLQWLMPSDFLLSTSKSALPHLPRYLKAINQRFEKLTNAGVKRDCDCLIEVSPRWNDYLDARKSLPAGQPESPEMERFRWLIEELRVSMFAQSLGTAEPVSIKRIDEAWKAIVGTLRK